MSRPSRAVLPCRPAHGFTLIELLTAMAVLVIALTLAGPALSGFLRSSRLSSAQSELVSSLMLARSEAARTGSPVGVSANAEAAAGGFGRGWSVWADADGNGRYDSGETKLREVGDFGGTVVVSTTGDVTVVEFSPLGFLVPRALVDLRLCGPAGNSKGWRVRVDPTGLADATEVTTCP